MRKRITLIILFVSLLPAVPAHAEQNKHTHRKYQGVMSDYFYDTLAQCETAGNWQHNTRTYTGGLGIAKGTWARWSNSSSAKGKDPRYQVQVADNIAFHGHTTDGVYKYPVGVYGWGCIKRSPLLKGLICKSRHPKVQRWKRGC